MKKQCEIQIPNACPEINPFFSTEEKNSGNEIPSDRLAFGKNVQPTAYQIITFIFSSKPININFSHCNFADNYSQTHSRSGSF